jgi:hypothetical protein
VPVTFRDPIEWETALGLRPSSPAWAAVVKAIYGSPLTRSEKRLLDLLTGDVGAPEGGALEVLAVVGRRGGKSETAARIATFEAIHGGHGIALARGQAGVFALVAPLREQAEELLGYSRGLATLPAIKRELARPPKLNEVAFKTGVSIRVMTADAVAVSGVTAVGAIFEEFAKFPCGDSVGSDREVEAAFRPALAPMVGAPPRRFIRITSAFVEEGVAYETDRACFGVPDASVYVVRGQTETFNPNIDRAWLKREARRNAREFAREYLGVWQSALVDGWFGDEVIDRSIDRGRPGPDPREPGVRYFAAMDQAFRGDRFVLAVAHAVTDGNSAPTIIVDAVVSWQAPKGGTLAVESTVVAVCAWLARYGLASALCDQFAAVPLAALFKQHGVALREIPWTGASKAPRFRQVRDAMVDERVRLPDDPKTIAEFRNIVGRVTEDKNERIAAGRGHDDRVSAVVLCASECLRRPRLSQGSQPSRELHLRPSGEHASLGGDLDNQPLFSDSGGAGSVSPTLGKRHVGRRSRPRSWSLDAARAHGLQRMPIPTTRGAQAMAQAGWIRPDDSRSTSAEYPLDCMNPLEDPVQQLDRRRW